MRLAVPPDELSKRHVRCHAFAYRDFAAASPAAQLIGVISRYIIKQGPLAQMPLQQLEHYLAQAIRATLLS